MGAPAVGGKLRQGRPTVNQGLKPQSCRKRRYHMLWCPACRVEISAEKKFCKRCGGPLQEKTRLAEPVTQSPTECPACHQVISAKAKFCKHCGKVLAAGSRRMEAEDPAPAEPRRQEPHTVPTPKATAAAALPDRPPKQSRPLKRPLIWGGSGGGNLVGNGFGLALFRRTGARDGPDGIGDRRALGHARV